MALHVFVAMPFGVKEGIDFNKIYTDYIKPALEDCSLIDDPTCEPFEVFRADEAFIAGNIRADMFQELLLSDLVVADLSIDNPNVWYELGVRHALRSRGVIQIMCRGEKTPFDVYTDRSLHFHIKDCVPDPDFLEADKKALAHMARETIKSSHYHKISPVYHLLPYLSEPDWKNLVVKNTDFWEKHQIWADRIKNARRRNRPGDILVLANEVPVNALRVEAFRCAGEELFKLKQFTFSLEQFENALRYDPTDKVSRQQKGILLGRLGKTHEARAWLKTLLDECPESAENIALLGRLEKDTWIAGWRKAGKSTQEMFEAAKYEIAFLQEAINLYTRAFTINPAHYYSGINALTLLYLQMYLSGNNDQLGQCKTMEGGIRWLLQSELTREDPMSKNYWARVTNADLEILTGDPDSVKNAYKNAAIAAKHNWFSLDSTLQQLQILKNLDFNPDNVFPAISIIEKAIAELQAPWQPQRVFLFSGHMIDAPDRKQERFPPRLEKEVKEKIQLKLKMLKAGPGDLALCGGACGGDILFAEICLNMGLKLDIHIPLREPEFLRRSVGFAGAQWRDRFNAIKMNPHATIYIAPEELGTPPKHTNPFGRNNMWMLYTSLSWGFDKVHFICLWDEKEADGRGGTEHLYHMVEQRTGNSFIINIDEILQDDKHKETKQ